MIEALAPTRISFLGGGTDVEPYASKYGGLVLSLAINIRQKIVLDTGKSITFPPEGSLKFYKTFLDSYKVKGSLKAYFDGEITGGIGSSASAAVALVGGLNRLNDIRMTRDQIAETAWSIETNELGMFGGKQDQYAAVYGGLNAIQFTGSKVTITPLSLDLIKGLLDHLMLFHTPNRKSTKIQDGLKELTPQKIQALDFIKGSVITGVEILKENNMEAFGNLTKAVWEAKKISNKVTTPEVDLNYNRALELGALGGKLMGSGGGGYMFFIVPPEKQFDFRKNFCLGDIKWVDFSPDMNGLEVREI
jgi:D-glycero-alpha-D-manno-heptose-7-phosphate kinase